MGDEHIAVTRFREYLRVNTEQPNPDYGSCMKFLSDYSEEIGLKHQILYPHEGKPVFVMTWEGLDPSLPSIFLYSHTDVVPVFKEHWKHDPFSAHKDEEGNIYARGSQDMKCVGIQYVEAVRNLIRDGKRCKRTVHIVFGPDEETGGELGMKLLVDQNGFKNLNVGFVLDEGLATEDDVYRVYYAERRPWWVKVTCKGNPGHGSKFIQNTAAEKFRKMIGKFLDFREEEERKLNSNPELCIGDVTTINMTIINGGVQVNVVPSELSADFDIRIPPTVTSKDFLSKMEGWLQEAGPDVSYEFVQCNWDPYVTDTSDKNVWWKTFCDVMEKLKLKYKKEVFTGATDARFVRAKGIPALNFSPMINTPILLHDHNEFLNEKVFLTGVDIYVTLIEEIANVLL